MNREKVNALLSALEKNVMAELVGPRRLTPHLIGPAATFALTVVVEFLSVSPWYTPSLSLAFIGLSISAVYGGAVANFASAGIIIAYGLIEFEYDIIRAAQLAVGALSVAAINTAGRRLLKIWLLEAEANRRKAELVDNLNGNLGKMLEALKILDQLRAGWDNYTSAKRFELLEKARGILNNLLTLILSWQEIAQTKAAALERLNEMSGYPYKMDDAIKNIEANQRAMLTEILRLRRDLEASKGGDQ